MNPDTAEERVILQRFLNILQPLDDSKTANIDAMSTSTARFQDLECNLDVMNGTRQNHAYRNIYSCRKYIGNLIVFCKRVIRKCLKWYLEPVCFQQTDFNNATTLATDRLRELQVDAFDRLGELDIQVRESEVKVNVRLDELYLQTQELASQSDVQLDALNKSIKESDTRVTTELKALDSQVQTLTTKTNLKLDENMHCLQRHDDQIGILTVEHNGRLDALESQIVLITEKLMTTHTQMAQLREQGAFDNVVGESSIIRRSASQSGEDGILAHVFDMQRIPKTERTYLDLGANHAKYLSNTYFFYQQGARGVLVEANPDLIGELKLYRSGDIILNRCVSEVSGRRIPFYILDGDGLSTPDRSEAETVISTNPSLHIVNTVEIETVSINELMETYFDGAPVFLNMDIEGREMQILNTMDFDIYRPFAVSIEVIPYRNHLVVGEKKQEIIDFMVDKDYVEYAFTGINSIFLDKRQLREVLA